MTIVGNALEIVLYVTMQHGNIIMCITVYLRFDCFKTLKLHPQNSRETANQVR